MAACRRPLSPTGSLEPGSPSFDAIEPMIAEPTGPRFRMRPGGLYLKFSRVLMLIGVLEILVGAGQLVVWVTAPTAGDGALVVLHLLFILTGLGMVGAGLLNRRIYLTAETRLTTRGLINREIRSRLIPWHTITDIRTVRRGRYWRIRVTLTSGRRKILIAPLTIASAPDPVFAQDARTIYDWWQRCGRG
jgi:hypothetical protein